MSKLREFWKKVVNKDKPSTPATPPPKKEAPAAVVLKVIQVAGERDPYHPSIATGEHEQFIAEGFYTDGSRKDLTGAVEWSSSAPAVASIDAKGKAVGKSGGDAEITAKDTLSGVSGSADITVTEAVSAVLKSIEIKPKNGVFFPHQTHRYEAKAVYANGATRDLTNSLDWSSTDPDVARMETYGSCWMAKAGSATITAKEPKTGVHASTKVTVETPPADLQKISLHVHATTFRGELMAGFQGAATLSASGA